MRERRRPTANRQPLTQKMPLVKKTLWTVASAGAVWIGFNFLMFVLSDYWSIGGGVFHLVYAIRRQSIHTSGPLRKRTICTR